MKIKKVRTKIIGYELVCEGSVKGFNNKVKELIMDGYEPFSNFE